MYVDVRVFEGSFTLTHTYLRDRAIDILYTLSRVFASHFPLDIAIIIITFVFKLSLKVIKAITWDRLI